MAERTQVNWAPFVHIDYSDVSTNSFSQVSGVGDLFLRTKINLWGDDGGKSAFALIPYVKAPIAPLGIGTGRPRAASSRRCRSTFATTLHCCSTRKSTFSRTPWVADITPDS